MNPYHVKFISYEEMSHFKVDESTLSWHQKDIIERHGYVFIDATHRSMIVDMNKCIDDFDTSKSMSFINDQFKLYLVKIKREVNLDKLLNEK